MSPGHSAEVKFEIGHVLFIDIVGYSKLLITEQSEFLRRLNDVVRETEQFSAADAQGKLVRLPTGDGMALVFRNSPEAPVQCALELSKRLKAHPELQVRMGTHSGPVNEVADVNGRANITGAGINVAQRVMDCGDAGHILLSKRVADDLEQYPRWRPHLHELGECEVKHGARVHVVNLYTEEVGNPEAPEKFRQAKATQTARATPVSEAKPARRSRAWITALIMVAAAAAAGFYLFSHRSSSKAPLSSAAPAPPATLEESIESEVAKAIADQMRAKLRGREKQVIAATPTDNPQASPSPMVNQLSWGMTDDQLLTLSRRLSPFASSSPKKGDLITAVLGDQDSVKFAQRLVGAFRAAHWDGVGGSGFGQAIFNGPVQGIVIQLHAADDRPPGLNEFVTTLRESGIEPTAQLLPESVPPNEFRIVVGSRPSP
jgi:class 3 adenylate cyclase